MDLFFSALHERDESLVEFAIGGLSNLLSGGSRVVEQVLSKDCDQRLRLLFDLLDRELGENKNDVIIVGSVVCLTCITRHGLLPPILKPVLTMKMSELMRNSDSSTFVLKNHAVILNELLS